MVDFRRWLLALAIVGLLLGISSVPANAQAPATFTCTASAGVPNILRSEGITELVGDLVLNCTGGTPTPAGQPIPLQNVQVSINTNITSRIVDIGGDSEALLMIDEPYPALAFQGVGDGGAFPPPVAGPSFPPSAAHALGQLGCQADNSTNCAITSVGVGIGTAGSYNGSAHHFNIFQGFQNGVNAIAWDGVPIDAPGTAGTRVIRITNVRANAFALGVSSTLIPTQISMIVAVSGSTFISILQPGGGNVVGNITQGLIGSNQNASYQQCVNLNGGLLHGEEGQGPTSINMVAREGFAASFKPQSNFQDWDVKYNAAADYVAPGNPLAGLQNIPGFNYNAESGFYPNIGSLISYSAAEPLGVADHGTQIQFNITGIGSGISLFAPEYVYLSGNYGAVPIGVAVLTSASFVSGGAQVNTSGIPVLEGPGPGGGAGPTVQLSISGTTTAITYEIYYADPSVIETLTVPLTAAYIVTGPTNPSPTTSAATVAINFAPLSEVGTADSTDPIPRFGQPYAGASLFSINSCTCNLLFPFVTNIAGFDTGVAIANTTADTLNGLAPQSGNVTLTYYGTVTGGGAAPSTQVTTSPVPAGSELIFTVSNGGNYGILATPGFEGYIIARTDFQYCHGFAFISDVGAQKLAEGYLAISLDVPVVSVNPLLPTGLNRTGQAGENEGH